MNGERQAGASQGPVRVTVGIPASDQLKTGGTLQVTLLPGGGPRPAAAAGAATTEQTVLAGISRVKPAMRGRAADLIKLLKSIEPQIMGWLHESPDNAKRFATDPVGALRASGNQAAADEVEKFVRTLVKGG